MADTPLAGSSREAGLVYRACRLCALVLPLVKAPKMWLWQWKEFGFGSYFHLMNSDMLHFPPAWGLCAGKKDFLSLEHWELFGSKDPWCAKEGPAANLLLLSFGGASAMEPRGKRTMLGEPLIHAHLQGLKQKRWNKLEERRDEW